MDDRNRKHFAWLARSFGRTGYLPLRESDLEALSQTGELIDKYPGTHLFKEEDDSRYAYLIERAKLSCIAAPKMPGA